MFSFTLRAVWLRFFALVRAMTFFRTPSTSLMVLAFVRTVAILIAVETLHYLSLWHVALYSKALVVHNDLPSDALICDLGLFVNITIEQCVTGPCLLG